MKELMEYINNSLNSLPEDKYLYAFKKKLVSEITERANEITHTGISDDKVIYDIITGEHPNIEKEFKDYKGEFEKKRKKKAAFRKTILGSAGYFLAVLIIFLVVSFMGQGWRRSWVFLVNGISLYVAYMSLNTVSLLSEKSGRYRPFSRTLLAISVFSFALPVFLIFAFLLRAPHSWLVFIAAIIAMFIVDGIYIEKQKLRFAIFFHLAYIPPAMTMFYIFFAVLKIIPWHPGWIMIPLSFLIVIAVILYRLNVHKKHKYTDEETEADSEW